MKSNQPVFHRRNRRFIPIFFRGFYVVFLGVFLIVGSGCASKPAEAPFTTRLYEGTYEDVWIAALKALNDYPLKLSNKDAGKIQSETINGPYNDLLFTYPEALELPERFRYSVRLNFAKLVSDEDRTPLVRIRLIKDLEKFNDFYTGWTPSPSDGLEEKVLLYRIEHILRMDKQLLKASSKGS